MSVARVGMGGHAPKVLVQPAPPKEDPEKAKYQKMWSHPEYRKVAPGEQAAQFFLSQAAPKAGEEVLDFGAGTGRGALSMAVLGGLKVTMLDFADNCLDEDIQHMLATQPDMLKFQLQDLRQPIGANAKYGFCTDVMEHIEPEHVDTVLKNILKAAQHVFFQISTVDDVMGALIGEPLHLTVKPYAWWLEQFRKHDCIVHWSHDFGNACMIYVSGWQDSSELVKLGHVNTDNDEIMANVRSAIARNLRLVQPFDVQDNPIMLLGGGPSLSQFEQEIVERRTVHSVPLVTTNGAYNWATERGLVPSAQIMVDAREFNNRFVEPVHPNTKYLLASQVHPSVFDKIPSGQIWLWHAGLNDAAYDEITKWHDERHEVWYPVPGGSTVMLRAIPLLRMLGFRRIEIYGFDSCREGQQHHAYSQPENDRNNWVVVSCAGRLFNCDPWMVSQAHEFMDLMKMMGDEISLIVHGDGLIAHIIKSLAEREDVEITPV